MYLLGLLNNLSDVLPLVLLLIILKYVLTFQTQQNAAPLYHVHPYRADINQLEES